MKKRSYLKNIYISNLLGLIFAFVLLSFTVLHGLDYYTQHGKTVEVPDVKGFSVEKAAPLFVNRGLNSVVVDSVYIKNVRPGIIAETTPPVGSMVKRGRTIYLKVASFLPQLIRIPDVENSSQRQSLAMLRSLGFENIEIKLVPGVYKDLALGIESNGKKMEAGQRVSADTPLFLLVSSGSDDILLIENPADSIELSVDSASL